MIFGDPKTFALEIGAVERYPGYGGLYVQFRFWIAGLPIGDWEDRISLVASIGYMQMLCETADVRREVLFQGDSATEVFEKVYNVYFELDYRTGELLTPDLRRRHHMDGIGMASIMDKYGLVAVASSNESERIIAKGLRQDEIIADVVVPFGFVESAGCDYVRWGQEQLAARAEDSKGHSAFKKA